MDSEERIAIIGFGEAGQAFAPGLAIRPRVYDRDTGLADRAERKRADYASTGVHGCDTVAEALAGTAAVLSLVTADEALAAATASAALLPPGAYWFDLNSVAPDTKRAAACIVEAAGGRYVDVAVMAPVHPARTGTPLLVSGRHADDGAALLRRLGFEAVRVVPGPVGRASSIKMIRSVMVKGMEALTAECVAAADRAGVLDEVLASLDTGAPCGDWRTRADYNLDRMMVHGLRRAAEMEEVAKTLDALGSGSTMTQGTVKLQRALGSLRVKIVPATLAKKLDVLKFEADSA